MRLYPFTFDGVCAARSDSYDNRFVAVAFDQELAVTIAYVSTIEDIYSVLTWSEYDHSVCAVSGATKKEVHRFLARQERARRLFESEPPFYTAEEMGVLFE